MKKSPIELINLVFSGLMVLITLAGAIVFLFTDLLSDRAYGNKRIVLGVVFLAYAIYRSYRMYTALKKEKEERLL
ncbi:MAG: hypothetical protein C0448_08770 [Sphingobacteriaceae bacterium]|nr:hypothetical protein [Sphingobacteriaceae bacterium]